MDIVKTFRGAQIVIKVPAGQVLKGVGTAGWPTMSDYGFIKLGTDKVDIPVFLGPMMAESNKTYIFTTKGEGGKKKCLFVGYVSLFHAIQSAAMVFTMSEVVSITEEDEWRVFEGLKETGAIPEPVFAESAELV